jgi:hypothetical protein
LLVETAASKVAALTEVWVEEMSVEREKESKQQE